VAEFRDLAGHVECIFATFAALLCELRGLRLLTAKIAKKSGEPRKENLELFDDAPLASLKVL